MFTVEQSLIDYINACKKYTESTELIYGKLNSRGDCITFRGATTRTYGVMTCYIPFRFPRHFLLSTFLIKSLVKRLREYEVWRNKGYYVVLIPYFRGIKAKVYNGYGKRMKTISFPLYHISL